MARAGAAPRHRSGIEIPGGGVGELVHGHVVERDIHVAAPAASRGAEERRGKREGGGHAAEVIDDREPQPRGRAFGLPGERKIARLGLHQVVVGRPGGPRPLAAVARQVQADKARVHRREGRMRQPQLAGLVAAQVVHHRVGALGQGMENTLPLGRLEVEREALLAAVEGLEEQAVVATEEMGPRLAGIVAAGAARACRRLDLDDLRAHVGHVQRTERSGAVLLHRENPDAVERRGRAHGPAARAASSTRSAARTTGRSTSLPSSVARPVSLASNAATIRRAFSTSAGDGVNAAWIGAICTGEARLCR